MGNRLLAFASDGIYRARRTLTINGVHLNPGDLLPSNSPLRQNPRRIELMCVNRQLIPGALEEKKGAVKKEAEAATTSASPKAAPVADPVVATPAVPKPKSVSKVKPAKVKKQKIDFEALSKAEIVKQLEDLGLRTNGSKEQLIERLKIALE